MDVHRRLVDSELSSRPGNDMASAKKIRPTPHTLGKVATGIAGFDEVTGGGLPLGRPTLVAGGPGCGKTLFGLEFLLRGIMVHGEPGVFVAFEETEAELAQNVASLGYDITQLIADRKLFIDYVRIERSEIEETGEYDLEGLFIRLGHALDSVKARRVVLDTLEALFVALPNQQILRAELRRLFRWLKDRGVTAIITAERGDGTGLTRHGIEEYVSDCVVVLDHRVSGQVSTRRLRVVKYRGSAHGTNEYPFLIGDTGISVLPITSMGLNHRGYSVRMNTGLPGLDDMLGGGFFKGSSVLLSGTPGSGKTSLACTFVNAACARGERCLYFPFEESPDQIMRNMRSIGMSLSRWDDSLLRFHAARPQAHGLETHLAIMHREIDAFGPTNVVVDPVTNLTQVSTIEDARAMLARLIDLLKSRGITAVFTSLTASAEQAEQTEVGVSSMMDTWILLRNLECNGERNRGLYVLKSRGTAHSNQIREFRLTRSGVQFLDVYAGTGGVLSGTARLAQESRDREAALLRAQEAERLRRELDRKREAMEAQIAAMRAAFAAVESEHQNQLDETARLDSDRVASTEAIQAIRTQGTANGRATGHPTTPRVRGSRRASPQEVSHGRRR